MTKEGWNLPLGSFLPTVYNILAVPLGPVAFSRNPRYTPTRIHDTVL